MCTTVRGLVNKKLKSEGFWPSKIEGKKMLRKMDEKL